MASINYSNARKYRHWGQDEEELVGSEAETRKRTVKELVHKQLSKRLNIEQQLENKSKFVKSTSQETVIGSTSGLASYEKFRDLESMVNAKEVLKSLGLSDSDVGLLYEEESGISGLEAPDARRERLEAIERKLAGRIKYHDRSELRNQSETQKQHQVTRTNKRRDSENPTKYPKQNDLSCQKEERGKLLPHQSDLNQLKVVPKLTQEEEEDQDLNPYQTYLKHQLREIAHRLFPTDQSEGGTCTGNSKPSVCFEAEELRDMKDNTSVYLSEETIGELFPIKNSKKERIRKRKSQASFESSELKRDKMDSTCVYLTEKPKTYWDMDKVPKIIQRRTDYPSGPYPSRPRSQGCETVIHVAKTMNRKGEECKTVKVTKNTKIYPINEIVNDTKDDEMNAGENNVNKMTQIEKNTNKVDLANKTIINNTKEYKKMNADENNTDKMRQIDKSTNTEIDHRNKTMIKETINSDANEDHNKINADENSIDRTTETDQNTNIEIDQRNKTINDTRDNDTNKNKKKINPDKNSIDKTTETNKNNTKVNPIDTTKKTGEDTETDDTNEGNSKDTEDVNKAMESTAEVNKTVMNDTKNKDTRENSDENTKIDQNKTTGTRKNNTGINTSRTVIRITKHDSKPDTTKPFILTLPESKLTPLSTIKTNRVSIQDLKKIDKFKNYEEGTPSQTLYLKNLSSAVSPSDLASIMGHFETPGGPKITYRVLGGRMKGQAFVTFPDVQTATEALKVCNGYLFYGRPLVAAYGKKG